MQENINNVLNNIKEAAIKSGRKKQDISIIAVSKMQPVSKILYAKENGIFSFGENKVQEILEKYLQVSNIEWHMIGHLQKNKVKYIVNKVKMIQSLDSIELAKEINKYCEKFDIIMPVLLEINIGKEESKSGIYEEDISYILDEITTFKNLKLSGIMTVAPKVLIADDSRKYFSKMKIIFEKIKSLNYECFDIKYLSMGMSSDYVTAIEEGSNMIRIGRGIFGERNYKGGNKNVK